MMNYTDTQNVLL